ncbi:MAG: DUF4956 domain-containing protein [candidate division KSB1 bacterium]|nr:DUF4956 domain-containing protein [candidate division KSB1 bacterium]MDZ7303592.1 DUF4956 domain-containing protein [candidate division KSB1 bacterium]MDZ7312835.1 DUF4956 domain-containing protein [candidate division KSB1 bacterium]
MNDKFQAFQKTFTGFLTSQSMQVSVWGFIINLILAAVLSFILARVYVKYGHSLSNRKDFSRNFVLITMTTMLIITIVKSSLALSLGLVGALSIVRFRAAIKEPEELSYLFFAIAIGLGLGADQREITLVGFAIIAGITWLRNYSHKTAEPQNLYLTVSSHNPHKVELKEIVDTLKKHCSMVDLKRFDESNELLEASFLVEFDDLAQLEESKASLIKLSDSVKITFLDNKGIR